MKSPAEMTDVERVAAEQVQIVKLGHALENAEKAKEWLDAMTAGRNEALNELRLLGWTIAELAELSGLSTAFVHKVNTEAGIISTRRAKRLGVAPADV